MSSSGDGGSDAQLSLSAPTRIHHQRQKALENPPPRTTSSHTNIQDASDSPALERPSEQCQNCGSHLSEMFRRGYGDNNDIVWHCIHCPEAKTNGVEGTAGHEPRDTL